MKRDLEVVVEAVVDSAGLLSGLSSLVVSDDARELGRGLLLPMGGRGLILEPPPKLLRVGEEVVVVVVVEDVEDLL